MSGAVRFVSQEGCVREQRGRASTARTRTGEVDGHDGTASAPKSTRQSELRSGGA